MISSQSLGGPPLDSGGGSKNNSSSNSGRDGDAPRRPPPPGRPYTRADTRDHRVSRHDARDSAPGSVPPWRSQARGPEVMRRDDRVSKEHWRDRRRFDRPRKTSRDARSSRDSRDLRDSRDVRLDSRSDRSERGDRGDRGDRGELRDVRDSRDSRDVRDSRDSRDSRSDSRFLDKERHAHDAKDRHDWDRPSPPAASSPPESRPSLDERFSEKRDDRRRAGQPSVRPEKRRSDPPVSETGEFVAKKFSRRPGDKFRDSFASNEKRPKDEKDKPKDALNLVDRKPDKRDEKKEPRRLSDHDGDGADTPKAHPTESKEDSTVIPDDNEEKEEKDVRPHSADATAVDEIASPDSKKETTELRSGSLSPKSLYNETESAKPAPNTSTPLNSTKPVPNTSKPVPNTSNSDCSESVKSDCSNTSKSDCSKSVRPNTLKPDCSEPVKTDCPESDCKPDSSESNSPDAMADGETKSESKLDSPRSTDDETKAESKLDSTRLSDGGKLESKPDSPRLTDSGKSEPKPDSPRLIDGGKLESKPASNKADGETHPSKSDNDVEMPDVNQPDVDQPDEDQPDVNQPDVDSPDVDSGPKSEQDGETKDEDVTDEAKITTEIVESRIPSEEPEASPSSPQESRDLEQCERTITSYMQEVSVGTPVAKTWTSQVPPASVVDAVQERVWKSQKDIKARREKFHTDYKHWIAVTKELDVESELAASVSKPSNASPSGRKPREEDTTSNRRSSANGPDVSSGNSNGHARRNRDRHSRAVHGDVARSEAEFSEILANLEAQTARDPSVRARLTSAHVPDQCQEPGKYRFVSTNAQIVDKSRSSDRSKTDAVDNFTEDEQENFIEAYVKWPKEFGKIADAVGRTFNECVMHYYRTKKTADYKGILQQRTRRKRGRKPRKKVNDGIVVAVSQTPDNISEESTPVIGPSESTKTAEEAAETPDTSMVDIDKDNDTAAQSNDVTAPVSTSQVAAELTTEPIPAASLPEAALSTNKAVPSVQADTTAETTQLEIPVPKRAVGRDSEATIDFRPASDTTVESAIKPSPAPEHSDKKWSKSQVASFRTLVSQHGPDFPKIARESKKRVESVQKFYDTHRYEFPEQSQTASVQSSPAHLEGPPTGIFMPRQGYPVLPSASQTPVPAPQQTTYSTSPQQQYIPSQHAPMYPDVAHMHQHAHLQHVQPHHSHQHHPHQHQHQHQHQHHQFYDQNQQSNMMPRQYYSPPNGYSPSPASHEQNIQHVNPVLPPHSHFQHPQPSFVISNGHAMLQEYPQTPASNGQSTTVYPTTGYAREERPSSSDRTTDAGHRVAKARAPSLSGSRSDSVGDAEPEQSSEQQTKVLSDIFSTPAVGIAPIVPILPVRPTVTGPSDLFFTIGVPIQGFQGFYESHERGTHR